VVFFFLPVNNKDSISFIFRLLFFGKQGFIKIQK
jgi:hypothetical protein